MREPIRAPKKGEEGTHSATRVLVGSSIHQQTHNLGVAPRRGVHETGHGLLVLQVPREMNPKKGSWLIYLTRKYSSIGYMTQFYGSFGSPRFLLAPASSSKCTISTWPSEDARIRASSP